MMINHQWMERSTLFSDKTNPFKWELTPQEDISICPTKKYDGAWFQDEHRKILPLSEFNRLLTPLKKDAAEQLSQHKAQRGPPMPNPS